MKAAVYQGGQRFEIEEIPTPTPGPGQVQMKVNYCAICGTDVHAFQYEIAPPGTVLGHEYCGVVTEVGDGVTAWKVGDRVIGGGGDPPAGQEPLTRTHPRFNYRTMGFPHGSVRGYAEYIVMDEWAMLAIPDEVSDEAAALTEPAAVAVHAVRNSDMKVGDVVGVIGAGPIGLLVTQAAMAAGASAVFVAEPSDTRREAAISLRADVAFDPFAEDTSDKLHELTGGIGPDFVFDCAGIRNTLEQAMESVRRQGQVVLVAVPWEPLALEPVNWMARETRLQASWGSRPEDWRRVVKLMQSGDISVDHMVSEASIVPLEGIQQAFEALMKPSTQLQMVVKP